MRHRMLVLLALACGSTVAFAGADVPISEEPLVIPLVPIAPGPEPPVHQESTKAKEFKGSAEQIAAGKQLYAAMNCVGCHFHGGGGMGPPLMDDTWIYGSSLEHIVSTIREGRPAGMPSFRGRLPDEQIWQIAAYVQTLSMPAQVEQGVTREN